MKNHINQFSLRVWLTAVLGSPVLYFICQLLGHDHDGLLDSPDPFQSCLFFYLLLVIYQLVFSFVTWIIFNLLIHAVVKYDTTYLATRLTISLAGMALTLLTFFAFAKFFSFISSSMEFNYLLMANILCIGTGSWYYKLETTDPLNEVETISPEY